MLNLLDRYLDGITMYKVMLYGLLLLAGIAILFGFFDLLHYKGYQYIISFSMVLGICWIVNYLFAKLYSVPTNSESSLITGLILFFLLSPFEAIDQIPFYIAAGFLSMGSKYILALHRKHIFNPAAFAAFILGLFGSPLVIWWIGSLVMLPFVTILGIAILRKTRRFRMFFIFITAAIFTVLSISLYHSYPLSDVAAQLFMSWPIVFFGTVMLTEPLTTPPTNRLRIIYATLVGVLFGSQFHIGFLFASPELALLIGNIYSYIVSSKQKLLLNLQEKKQIARDMYEFLFIPKGNFTYMPGQYMEWTLPHKNVDIRGNRRYFTVASSPTEATLRLGVKVIQNGSSFKKNLIAMDEKSFILAGQLSGDFTLPKDASKKLVFLAGGIGITPFRSMIKYLVDKNEKRDITLLYSNKTADEIVYKDVFDEAEKKLHIKTIYTITDKEHLPENWNGEKGRVDAAMIQKYIPDYKERVYYISGPHIMVTAYEDILKNLGISSSHIIIDYFPGFV
ncbi:MAG: oxidoreductase [Candidatus Levybacteria bacterium]|nr:oxidoreductase [Candidatus Levybacteria bacterium]